MMWLLLVTIAAQEPSPAAGAEEEAPGVSADAQGAPGAPGAQGAPGASTASEPAPAEPSTSNTAVAAVATSAVTSTAPPTSEKPRVLILDLERSGVEAEQAKLVSGLITDSMSRLGKYEVISSADLRQLVDVEADRVQAGCDTSSCLAEVAGAMGARWVVFGNIGKLGDITILTLSLFDTAKATAVGRERVEAKDIEKLPKQIDRALAALIGEPIPPPESEVSPLVVTGAIVGGLGAAGAVLFGISASGMESDLGRVDVAPEKKEDALKTGPLMLLGVVIASAVAVAGGGIAIAAAME